MLSILVVDDDADIRDSLADWLETWGAEVHTARDGMAAVESMTHRRVDLVITDLVMPEVEGLETIQWVRTYFPKVKIFAMSGCGSIANTVVYLAMARKLGALAALQKPFRLNDLNKLIDKHFPNQLCARPALRERNTPQNKTAHTFSAWAATRSDGFTPTFSDAGVDV